MLSKNKSYTRKEPDKEAKLFVIFCEGLYKENLYFNYFNGISSQIKFKIIPPISGSNHSPTGLYNVACKTLIKSEKNPNPEITIDKIDEIWFVIDTDSWGKKINELRGFCLNHKNWEIAQSNPCFEVWLYYHFYNKKPEFDGIEISKKWKEYLGLIISGGFDLRKHPVHIEKAITNAKANFILKDMQPDIASTEVYKLAERILPLVKMEIDVALINRT